ncbi:MAG: hypothetical protein A2086_17380 [Spirochaetes bacterium GWD1_27_9]|nr:MAG: hypothetical protein A2Y34_07590 [Spirochaetes bacterium GWC1_27_15]OHD42993.1 MAG: hypothetical protein A2086_17380 [Spirochaetes bacterium GWD1_27_9]
MESFYSNQLKRNWKYRVYLPNSYKKDNTKYYEILYLLHGHGGNEDVWIKYGNVNRILDRLYNEDKIRDFIVIMPDGGNSWYVDGVENMESAIIKDLIPKIEKYYRVKIGRQYRSIGGMSAGGYGSLRFVLKYPELFINGILMSPSAYYPLPDSNSSAITGVDSFKDANGNFSEDLWKTYNYDNYWNIFDSSNCKPHNFYISVGTDDIFKSIIKIVNEQLPAAFSKRSANVFLDIKNYNGGHDMGVWKQAFEYAITQIYKK